MRIISWNLNGLQSCVRAGAFKELEDMCPDIFCGQEIRTKQQSMVFDEGYDHFWNPAQREGYSGTVSASWDPPLSVLKGLGDELLDREGRILTLEYPACYVVNVYAPNSQRNMMRHQYRLEWDAAFRTFVCQLKEKKPVIACGDFNAPRLPIDVFPENMREYWAFQGYMSDERAGLEALLDEGFVDAFRYLYPEAEGKYTWWSNRLSKRMENRGWRLDYFFVDEAIKDKIKDVRHLVEVKGSDHCPIVLDIAL